MHQHIAIVKTKTKERELFYEQLASEIHKTPNKNFLITLRDFNAKTGSGHNEFSEQIGKYGKGKMNSTGRTRNMSST